MEFCDENHYCLGVDLDDCSFLEFGGAHRMKTKLLMSLSLLGGCLLASAPFVRASDVVPGPEPAIQNLATCLATKLDLEAVVLIDESVSLRKTDPQGRREALAKDIISAFGSAALQTVDGVSPRLDVLVVGFGSDLTNVVNTPLQDNDWITLSDSSTPDLLAKLASFKDRHNDRDTDYVDALQGASRLLGMHASKMKEETGTDPCRVIVWFTDGKFDIERASVPRAWAPTLKSPDQAESTGRQLLCGNDGIANSLRLQQTFLLTVALISGEFKTEDSSLLRKITLGGDCGVASADGLGFYREDTNFDQIRSCLSLALSGFPCGDPPSSSCTASEDACVKSIEVTTTDLRVSGVVIANSLSGDLSLRAPNGDTVNFSNGTDRQTIGDATFEYSGNEGIYNFTIDLKDSDNQATGKWTFSLLGDPQGTLDLQHQKIPGFKFELSAPQETELKESIDVKINLIGRDGKPADFPKGFVGTFRPRVIEGNDLLATPSFEPVVIEKGKSASFTVTPEKSGGSVIRLVVDATVSSEDGTRYKLAPKEIEIRITDPGLPVIPVASIDFGFVDAKLADKKDWDTPESPKALPFSKTLKVAGFRGATTGDSSICLNQPVEFSTLSEMETTVRLVGGEDGCVLLNANEEKALEFELSASRPISGSLVGSSEFIVTNLITGDSSVVSLPVEAQIDVPVPPLTVDSKIVIREFLAAVLLVILAYGLASLILAVLWRTSNRRRLWEFEFRLLSTGYVQKLSSPKDAMKGFILSEGRVFGPWRAIEIQTGIRVRSRFKLLGNPQVAFLANTVYASSGTVSKGFILNLKESFFHVYGKIRRMDEKYIANFGSRAIVDQPITWQWLIVSLSRGVDGSLTGRLVVIGPSEKGDYVDPVGNQTMEQRIRLILSNEVADQYQELCDILNT